MTLPDEQEGWRRWFWDGRDWRGFLCVSLAGGLSEGRWGYEHEVSSNDFGGCEEADLNTSGEASDADAAMRAGWWHHQLGAVRLFFFCFFGERPADLQRRGEDEQVDGGVKTASLPASFREIPPFVFIFFLGVERCSACRGRGGWRRRRSRCWRRWWGGASGRCSLTAGRRQTLQLSPFWFDSIELYWHAAAGSHWRWCSRFLSDWKFDAVEEKVLVVSPRSNLLELLLHCL